jgi:hypothetical protein
MCVLRMERKIFRDRLMAGQRSLEPRMVRVRIPLPEPVDERLWSSGKTLRRQRGDCRFNSGQPLQDFDSGCLLVWQKGNAPHS